MLQPNRNTEIPELTKLVAQAAFPSCTHAKNVGRTLTVYPQKEYEALLMARQRQETKEFKELYASRAGIEGTISQVTRSMGLRRSRYIGLALIHLQRVATAAAINLVRAVDWMNGHRSGGTYVSPFMVLAANMS
jgi:transposase